MHAGNRFLLFLCGHSFRGPPSWESSVPYTEHLATSLGSPPVPTALYADHACSYMSLEGAVP